VNPFADPQERWIAEISWVNRQCQTPYSTWEYQTNAYNNVLWKSIGNTQIPPSTNLQVAAVLADLDPYQIRPFPGREHARVLNLVLQAIYLRGVPWAQGFVQRIREARSNGSLCP